jgi:lipocalin
MLVVQCVIGTFNLNKGEALELEKKINLTKYKRTWINIAKILFRYATGHVDSDTMIVDVVTFRLLNSLNKMIYQDVKNQNYFLDPESF